MIKNAFKWATDKPDPSESVSVGKQNLLIITREQAVCGDVCFDGTVQIDGSVDGDVQANRVLVTAHAVLNGMVTGKTVRIDGTVNGPIDGGTVILAPTAYVKGNIDYDMLNIVSGASVHGLCRDKRDARPALKTSPSDAIPIPFNLVKSFPRQSHAPKLTTKAPPRVAEPAPSGGERRESMMDVWESYTQEEQQPV